MRRYKLLSKFLIILAHVNTCISDNQDSCLRECVDVKFLKNYSITNL